MKNNPGRNETCHCGSGKKFKNCHGKTIEKSSQSWVIIAVIFLFLLWFLFFETTPPAKATSYSPAPLISKKPNLTSQATGPAPPGKVWSEEHGHWHDAPLAPTTLPGQPRTSEPKSQNPGDPPPGKVWSPEHDHWHDQK